MGWRSGMYWKVTTPVPWLKVRAGAASRPGAAKAVVGPVQLGWQRARAGAGRGCAVKFEIEQAAGLQVVLGDRRRDAGHLVGERITRIGRGAGVGRRVEIYLQFALHELVRAAVLGCDVDRAGSWRTVER